ncbi:MAG: NUDIX domain-containing protein, partial [Woeseiaceae bacterium]
MRIRVVAGILRDRAGRVLLAERQKDIKFNDLWEFPGGKREPSEMPEEALARELKEELGIELTRVEKFLSLDHDYADRFVHIDFFVVTEWRGEPRPMDGQGL